MGAGGLYTLSTILTGVGTAWLNACNSNQNHNIRCVTYRSMWMWLWLLICRFFFFHKNIGYCIVISWGMLISFFSLVTLWKLFKILIHHLDLLPHNKTLIFKLIDLTMLFSSHIQKKPSKVGKLLFGTLAFRFDKQ